MQILRNNNTLPDTDWRTWNKEINEDFHNSFDNNKITRISELDKRFRFSASHEVWEHPAVSELAKQSRADYGDLDYDSDSRLTGLFNSVWAKDIRKRLTSLPSTISKPFNKYENVQEEVQLNRNILEAYYEQKAEKDKAIFSEEELKKQENDLIEEMIGNRRGNDTRPEYVKTLHSEMIKLEKKIWPIIKEILVAMVEVDYAISEESINEYVVETYRKKKSNKDYDFNDETIWKLTIQHGSNYILNIVAFPGANLPSYFHDEMVFMNYIQSMVGHEGDYTKREKEIVDSQTLLNGSKQEIVALSQESIQFAGGWWT